MMKSYGHYWTSTLPRKNKLSLSVHLRPGIQLKSLLRSRNEDNLNVNGEHRDYLLTASMQYVHQCNVVINPIKSGKSEHYSSVIKENSGNQNVLVKTVQKLLQKSTVNYYLPSENDRMLADEFATFFT